MEKNLKIIIGHPFENEWETSYDVFSEDKIDPTIPFEIKNSLGETVLSLEFNYGLTIIKFDDEDGSRLVASIYETDLLEEGEYSYSYKMITFSGNEILNISGRITVSSDRSDASPKVTRDVRPWDLLRSKNNPAGERADSNTQKERMSICSECPRFVKITSQCLECGCIMKLKTKLAAATCPLGKW